MNPNKIGSYIESKCSPLSTRDIRELINWTSSNLDIPINEVSNLKEYLIDALYYSVINFFESIEYNDSDEYTKYLDMLTEYFDNYESKYNDDIVERVFTKEFQYLKCINEENHDNVSVKLGKIYCYSFDEEDYVDDEFNGNIRFLNYDNEFCWFNQDNFEEYFPKFEEGDKVICIKEYDYLDMSQEDIDEGYTQFQIKLDEEYTISGCEYDDINLCFVLSLEEDENYYDEEYPYTEENFKLSL